MIGLERSRRSARCPGVSVVGREKYIFLDTNVIFVIRCHFSENILHQRPIRYIAGNTALVYRRFEIFMIVTKPFHDQPLIQTMNKNDNYYCKLDHINCFSGSRLHPNEVRTFLLDKDCKIIIECLVGVGYRRWFLFYGRQFSRKQTLKR
jgi:hypothetical protein